MTGELRIKHKTGTPLTPKHQQEFLEVAMDDRLTPDEKKRIYSGELGYQRLLSQKQQKQVTEHQQQIAQYELNELSPCYVDPRIEELRKLNPQELNKRLNY